MEERKMVAIKEFEYGTLKVEVDVEGDERTRSGEMTLQSVEIDEIMTLQEKALEEGKPKGQTEEILEFANSLTPDGVEVLAVLEFGV